MKLAVSNIAWTAEEEAEAEAYRLLSERGVSGLEVAPGLLFPGADDPLKPGNADCKAALARLSGAGLTPCSMQSLLFGVDGAALFGTPQEQAALDDAMRRVAGLAGRLGVPNLVFGSPKNRVVPADPPPGDVRATWTRAFRAMGDAAAAHGANLALETNPESYGTNFMTSLAETVEVVRTVDHPGVTVNLDLGALVMTGEIDRLDTLLPEAMPLVSHVHLSAPFLAPLTEHPAPLRPFVAALAREGWSGWVSIEMRGGLDALGASIALVQNAMKAAG